MPQPSNPSVVTEPSPEQCATLLVITDELRSAERRDPNLIRQRTSKHFARFIQLLAELPTCGDGSVLVKNVGDSLMIRVEVSGGSNSIYSLLTKIIDIQQQLHNENLGGPIDIRVLVTKCDEQTIEGHELHLPLLEEIKGLDRLILEKKLPGARRGWAKNKRKSWLNGDLFGSAIARAFRASGIPKGRELIIEDSVAKLLDPSIPDDGNTIQDLHVGPRVAFSPIKGMHDLYDIRRPQYQYGNLKWEERDHVWLRTVSQLSKADPAAANVNPLLFRRQQIRVLTELSTDLSAVDFWAAVLEGMDNKAHYFCLVGRCFCAKTWTKPPNENVREEQADHAELVVLGAYPEFDTYFNIREAISALAQQVVSHSNKKLLWARTSMFWSPGDKRDVPVWPRGRERDVFILLLGRAFDRDRTDSASVRDTAWEKALRRVTMLNSSPIDLGAVMGEWDYYAIYRPQPPTNPSAEDLALIETSCRTVAGSMERLRMYVCTVGG